MKQHLPHPPPAPVTLIEELRAERRLVEALLDRTPYVSQQPDSLRRRRDELCEGIEQQETRGDGGPRLTVTLDAYASAIVRRIMGDEPDATKNDVATAALTFAWGEKDDHDSETELRAAIQRRRAVNRSKGKEAR